MTHRGWLYAVVLGCASGAPIDAQRGAASVHGVVFDSLRGQPLRNASVTIPGRLEPVATDALGRFRFDSVPPGLYTVTAQHPLLDSIGLSGLAARATAGDGGRDVALAIPSFETLWRLSCRGRAPRDSGIVFGTVRQTPGGAPVANAAIELAWSDLMLDRRHVVDRTWRVETQTNTQGGYAVCGVPTQGSFRIRARTDSTTSGIIDLPAASMRVRRRDLSIGARGAGTIVGTVLDADGGPAYGARVLIDGGPEARTGADGRFVLSGVHVGTQQIEVRALGAVPELAVASVAPGDTEQVVVRLQKIVALGPVRTTARGNRVLAAEFDLRRKTSFAYTRDSIALAKYDQLVSAFRDVPSLDVQYRSSTLTITVPAAGGGRCMPDVLIDGTPAAFGHLLDLQPSEVGGLEVYTRATQIPAQFVPPGIHPQCGMILVWTKYGFRNR